MTEDKIHDNYAITTNLILKAETYFKSTQSHLDITERLVRSCDNTESLIKHNTWLKKLIEDLKKIDDDAYKEYHRVLTEDYLEST